LAHSKPEELHLGFLTESTESAESSLDPLFAPGISRGVVEVEERCAEAGCSTWEAVLCVLCALCEKKGPAAFRVQRGLGSPLVTERF
jgi:hypothetical protein